MASSRGLAVLLVVCLMLPGALAWPLVKSGDSGSTVVAVQDLLKARDYSLAADGSFGSITASKVKEFQSANGLDADGIVGPLTWRKLILQVQSGDKGPAVHAVQYLLVYKHGFLAGAGNVDGQFGQTTKNAVISFQSSKGLTQDGIVGPKTWEALVS